MRVPRNARGSQLVEAGLVLLPLFAMIFLLFDGAWAVFVKATLQHAVREGVRYAVTGRVEGGLGQINSIKQVVRDRALGLLTAQPGALAVRFIDSATLTVTNNNAGGNLVEVSVENFAIVPVAPLFRSSTPVLVTVRAADRIEPNAAPPAP